MADARIELLLDFIDQAFRGPSWHGTPLWGALRGVTAEQARMRPGTGRHTVWELVLHAAYWKYVVRRRLTRDESLEFPRSPSNWPAAPSTPSEAAWKADKALLKKEHDQLRSVVARFPARELGKKAWKSRYTNRVSIEGIAAHDLYHCGQIQLVKRLTAV